MFSFPQRILYRFHHSTKFITPEKANSPVLDGIIQKQCLKRVECAEMISTDQSLQLLPTYSWVETQQGSGITQLRKWSLDFQLSRTLPFLCSWKPEARSCKLDTRCKSDCSGVQYRISKAGGVRTTCMHLAIRSGHQV